MSRVALVTTDPEVVKSDDVDLQDLRSALDRLAIEVQAPIWHDPEVDWSGFDLAIMRSPWDYPDRLDEFLGWLDRTSRETEVLNCRHVIRWNLDKRYLLELEERGVEIVPCRFVASLEELDRTISLTDAAEIVVKPSISNGSQDTGRFHPDDPAIAKLAAFILAAGKLVLIQPCIPSVASQGERELVYFDGVFSHALYKGPILAEGGGYIGGKYSEHVEPDTATAADIALADTATIAITDLVRERGCDCADPTPLYGRFDIIYAEDGPQLLEAELFEPLYFVKKAPGAADRFASCVSRRLRPIRS